MRAAYARGDEAQPPLTLERTIPLADVSGRIDHMAVDLRRGRLFVAELGNDTVDVVDLATGRVVHRIGELREPQGIGYAPTADIIAVANAGDGSVRLYKGQDFAPVGRVDLGDDADNVRLDAHSGNFLVGYGTGGIATLDAKTGAVLSKAALSAHPEGFRVDQDGRRALVNLPNAGQIAAVDLTTGKQTATWRVPDLRANFPMAWDEDHGVIAVVFRSPSRLVLLDSGTGSVKAKLKPAVIPTTCSLTAVASVSTSVVAAATLTCSREMKAGIARLPAWPQNPVRGRRFSCPTSTVSGRVCLDLRRRFLYSGPLRDVAV
jgi:hypothetical protein